MLPEVIMCYHVLPLFEYLFQKESITSSSNESIANFFQHTLGIGVEHTDEAVALCVKNVLTAIKRRWSAARRTRKQFVSINEEWLKKEECLPTPICASSSCGSGDSFNISLFF